VDWLNVLPILRLGGALRLAMQPGKLVVALLAIVLLHLCGITMDAVWPAEDHDSSSHATAEYGESRYANDQRRDSFDDADFQQDIYRSILEEEREAFRQLMSSALSLDHGFGPSQGVADSLLSMVVMIPAKVVYETPAFALTFGLIALVILLLASGIICRMAAVQLCLDKATSLPRARRFVMRRWSGYLLGPLLPMLLICVIAGVLMLAGLVFFNVAVLDVIGSLLYGPMLLAGFVIALVATLLVFALFMMPAAMSVEGSDGFDVIARTFNYVLFKPWQFAAYLIGSMVYLAAVYVLVTALAGVTVVATQYFVDIGSVAEVTLHDRGDSTTTQRFTAITEGSDGAHSGAIDASHWIMQRWLDFVSALVAAVVFSVLCCLQTQVYVLMRRSADGAPLELCAAEDEHDLWSSPEDMVDPVAQRIAEEGPTRQPKPDASAPADDKAADASTDKPGDSPTES